MIKKIIRIFILLILVLILFGLGFLAFLFIGQAPPAEKIDWGVSFSQLFAEKLDLDWRVAYQSILDDLQVKKLRLIAYWPMIELKPGEYFFDDLDWQIEQAAVRGSEVILVIGIKVPRWPECHIPDWAHQLTDLEKQERILLMLEQIISHYQNNQAIKIWQIENEPFLGSFGECPFINKDFLRQEVALVRGSDLNRRPIMITASGELTSWIETALEGDILGTSLYRIIWTDILNDHFKYPIPAIFYYRRAQLVRWLTDVDRVILAELQGEPWSHLQIYETTREEQNKSMDLEKFKEIIEYTRKTGSSEVYFWGAEWWYWLKEKHNDDSFWQQVQQLTNE